MTVHSFLQTLTSQLLECNRYSRVVVERNGHCGATSSRTFARRMVTQAGQQMQQSRIIAIHYWQGYPLTRISWIASNGHLVGHGMRFGMR